MSIKDTPHVSLKKEGEGEYYNNTDDKYYVMIILAWSFGLGL
jgi:hypothetical protein